MESCSVFDLDHTLLIDNASYRFGRHLYKKGLLRSSPMLKLMGSYFLQRLFFITPFQLHQLAIHYYFRYQRLSVITTLAREFCQSQLDKLWYPPALALWKQARASGHKVLLLSSSPDFIVQPIAEQLGADEWHGTVYQCDSLGYFSTTGQVMDGEIKKMILAQTVQRYGYDFSQVAAYSDSILDLPLLSSVGHPVGVRPDKRLKKHCYSHGWQII